MYSSESQVLLSNGQLVSITSLRPSSMILNHLDQVVRVERIEEYTNQTGAYGIQFNNGTGVFYAIPSNKVYATFVNATTGHHTARWASYSEVLENDGKIKGSNKIFSPNSDILITNYNTTGSSKTLYCIYTRDKYHSFYVNGAITYCGTS
jgi:hypothetical protein